MYLAFVKSYEDASMQLMHVRNNIIKLQHAVKRAGYKSVESDGEFVLVKLDQA